MKKQVDMTIIQEKCSIDLDTCFQSIGQVLKACAEIIKEPMKKMEGNVKNNGEF